MSLLQPFKREITSLSPQDCFLVMNRIRDNLDYPTHFHPELELNFIANGKGIRRTVGLNSEIIDDYELVLLGPNVHHNWEMNTCDHQIHEITIQFHNDLLSKGLLRRNLMQPLRDMFARSTRGLLFDKKEVIKLAPRLMNLSKLNGFEGLIELFKILHKLSETKGQRLLSHEKLSTEDFGNRDQSREFYFYIQENFHKKITLKEVADHLNMSIVSLNRFVKKVANTTFVNYLNKVRIDYAAEMLTLEEYPVSEIAFRCGFNNLSNFNRVFKKLKLITPLNYRRQHRAEQLIH